MKVYLFLPNLVGAGAERVAIEIAKNLSLAPDLDVKIVIQEYRGELLGEVPQEMLEILGNRKTIKSFFLWRRKIIRERPDVIISFMNTPSLLSILAVISVPLLSTKVIATVHSDVRHEINKANLTWYGRVRTESYKIFFKKADKIVCVSNGIEKLISELWSIPDEKLMTIYNPVNIKTTPGIERNFDHCKSVLRICTVGRLTEQKSIETQIKALSVLSKKYGLNVILDIVGQGEKEGELKTLAKNLGVHGNVNFHGFSNSPFSLLTNSHVFVLSSINEGFGNVIVEAMAESMPIISSDCDFGPREILCGERYGLLFNVGDYEMLANIIKTLIDDPDKLIKMSLASKKRAKDLAPQYAFNSYRRLLSDVCS